MPNVVTIIHTNDFHNHLKPPQAEAIRLARELAEPDVLLLDAGDAVSAGNIGVRPGGEPILSLMSEIGYDAMTMGNREFHVSGAALRHKIGNAAFPILCANLHPRRAADAERLVVPRLVKSLRGGARVGVIGVTVPMVTDRMGARHLSSFVFDDPVAVARGEAAELRGSVDLLIALTHIGIKADEQLAVSCPELDLIVTGHTHLIARPGERPGAPIVQAGWFAHYYGVARFEIAGGGRPVLLSHEIRPLGSAA